MNLGVAAWDEDQTPCSLDCSQIRYCPGHQAPIGLKEVLIFAFDITNSRYIQKSLAKNITQQKKGSMANSIGPLSRPPLIFLTRWLQIVILRPRLNHLERAFYMRLNPKMY